MGEWLGFELEGIPTLKLKLKSELLYKFGSILSKWRAFSLTYSGSAFEMMLILIQFDIETPTKKWELKTQTNIDSKSVEMSTNLW